MPAHNIFSVGLHSCWGGGVHDHHLRHSGDRRRLGGTGLHPVPNLDRASRTREISNETGLSEVWSNSRPRPMVQAVILLEVGILAVSFGVVMARRGYIAAHKKPYSSSNGRLPLGAALIVAGFGCIMVGAIML